MVDVRYAVKVRPSKNSDTWQWVDAADGHAGMAWWRRGLYSRDEAKEIASSWRECNVDARVVRVRRTETAIRGGEKR